jgi:hypothetical protein
MSAYFVSLYLCRAIVAVISENRKRAQLFEAIRTQDETLPSLGALTKESPPRISRVSFLFGTRMACFGSSESAASKNIDKQLKREKEKKGKCINLLLLGTPAL